MKAASYPLARQQDFTSRINGKAYRLRIATPYGPPPEGGYPVLYVLDGDGYFGSFADAARLRAAAGLELPHAVVVGVGYPGEDFTGALGRRFLDLTPTEPDAAEKANHTFASGEIRYAGADDFLEILTQEVRARVAEVLPVDPARESVFGHSLGGLFVLHSLFRRPDAFSAWLSLSPSIWWDDRVVLKGEAGFASALAGLARPPRLFVGVGSLEQPEGSPARMVDNAVELSARFSALSGPPGWRFASKIFEGETHTGVVWPAINPLLDFALKDA
ncbi:alpha/beta hydrolase-fold protein [Phenylobacterium sp.]|jgi:predicted alpha/beta superfamily hydrolase|uniref:alpha/beta hydrolase n=1 Tax=Phenylobacterium sp. TaxID=1871053 RepID=UPI0025DED5B1|nr:alpha/beta hydrolase-fold protein [Phenylobacterium sp.]MCA3739729.1 alpha/beta hydrolase [Phenylobacterium sp.]MCA3745388.1 alpha/beta hydrolase [Phenylobacterium sp.]MCA3752142.1 alpha/beta hydrolase [Phenylobacterium sp.]